MKSAALVFVLVALPFAGAVPDPAPAPSVPGRFQIITGATPAGGQSAVTIRLDTATGRTWMLHELAAPVGGTVTGWAELSDDVAKDLMAMERAASPSNATAPDQKPSKPWPR